MSEDYRSMWQALGLDLAAHDALLGVLGKFYQDIYLAQKERPEAMGYFDFVMSEVHGLRIKELLDEKAAGPHFRPGRAAGQPDLLLRQPAAIHRGRQQGL